MTKLKIKSLLLLALSTLCILIAGWIVLFNISNYIAIEGAGSILVDWMLGWTFGILVAIYILLVYFKWIDED